MQEGGSQTTKLPGGGFRLWGCQDGSGVLVQGVSFNCKRVDRACSPRLRVKGAPPIKHADSMLACMHGLCACCSSLVTVASPPRGCSQGKLEADALQTPKEPDPK